MSTSFLLLLMANKLKEKKQRHHGRTYLYLFLLFQLLPYAAAQNSNNQAPPSDSNGYGYGYGYGFSVNFSPAMVIILVVIISFFFFLGFFSIYIRSCTGRDGNGGSIRPAFLGGGMSRRANRGLDPAVIETFPTFEYSVVKGLKLGKGALECAVCLNEFEDDEKIRLLPKCDHAFHPECIDVWLSNRTTCPVCRANLVPEPGETSGNTDLEDVSEGEIRESETVDDEEIREVSIHVISEEEPVREVAVAAPEVINPVQASTPNRPTRSRSTRPRNAVRFPRSHSTGHSLVQPGEDIERFTLRLPEEVRKQIMNQRLNRTRSMVVFPRAGSTRRGNRMTGEGSSRGGRFTRLEMAEKPEGWVFSKTPPFFMRASSARLPQMPAEGDSTVTPAPLPPLPPRPFRSSLRGSTKSDGSGQSLTRPSV